jgi:hypothetical protein
MSCTHKRKYHLVYTIQNRHNRKLYIGKHSTDNPDDNYMGSGVQIAKAVKFYGRKNFSTHFTKRVVGEFNSEQAAFDFEEALLGDNWKRSNYYNQKKGGGKACDGVNCIHHNRYDLSDWRENTMIYDHHYEAETGHIKIVFKCEVCDEFMEKWRTEVYRINSTSKRRRTTKYVCPRGCSTEVIWWLDLFKQPLKIRNCLAPS